LCSVRLLQKHGIRLVLTHDYVVVGANFTGLIAAQALALSGCSVVLIGPNPLPGQLNKHIACSFRTIETLKSWGIHAWPEYGRFSKLILGVSGEMGWEVRATQASDLGLNIHQDDLYHLCQTSLMRDVLHLPTTVDSIIPTRPQGYELRCADGARVHARYLIAADGPNSCVRQILKPRWQYLKKSLNHAMIFQSMQKACVRDAAYQYAYRGLLAAFLPCKEDEGFYTVMTGSLKTMECYRDHSAVILPLWNYQVENSLGKDIAYIGWAGQSWDPNIAAGLGQTVWEIALLINHMNTQTMTLEQPVLMNDALEKRRSLLLGLMAKDRLFLQHIAAFPQKMIQTHLECFAEQSLELTPCLCPDVLI